MYKSLLTFLIPCILLVGCTGHSQFKNSTKEASLTADNMSKIYEFLYRDMVIFRESILKLAYITSSSGPMDRNVRFDAGNQILKALECDPKQADTWKDWAKKLTSDVDDPIHPHVSDEIYKNIVKDLINSYKDVKTNVSLLKDKSKSLNYQLAVLSGAAGNSHSPSKYVFSGLCLLSILALVGAFVNRSKLIYLFSFLFKK